MSLFASITGGMNTGETKFDTGPIADYLTADAVIQSDHPEIIATAKSIITDGSSELEKIQALFEWVRDEISHSADADRPEVTCSSIEVLQLRTGACYAKSHLLAALLRSQDIPCGFCYQTFEADGVSDLVHGLNGVFLSETKTWIRFDPRGNAHGCSSPALFDLSNENARLAFPEFDFLDRKIYASPLENVLTKLRQHTERSHLWKDLPRAP